MTNTEESPYGECCCCLKKGDHRELTKQYYFNERPERYEVLFKETFDIVLKYPETTKLICDCCIGELRQAKRFRSIVESSQQSLSDRINCKPEFVNVEEDPLEQLNTEIDIKSEPDTSECQEESDNDVDRSQYSLEQLNNDIKQENSEEPSHSTVSISIKHESDDDMEDVPIVDQANIQVNSDCPTSSKKLAVVNKVLSSGRSYEYRKPTTKLHLKQHLQDIIREKQFYCSLCDYKTKSKSCITNHTRTHTGEKPFSCNMCQYKTAEKVNLTRHIRTHTGEKPFSCNICQYKSAIKENLIIHMRSHTGEKPFSCNICQYKTVGQNGLARHMRTHTGEKPYSCDFCQYTTARRHHLNSHIRIHTGKKLASTKISEEK